MRAVADDRDLAEASGIDVSRVILATWMLGAALAALGGVLLGLSETVVWDMGFTLLLLMFAAVVLGGIGTAYGPMVGGIVIGVASQVSTYWIEPKYRIGGRASPSSSSSCSSGRRASSGGRSGSAEPWTYVDVLADSLRTALRALAAAYALAAIGLNLSSATRACSTSARSPS